MNTNGSSEFAGAVEAAGKRADDKIDHEQKIEEAKERGQIEGTIAARSFDLKGAIAEYEAQLQQEQDKSRQSDTYLRKLSDDDNSRMAQIMERVKSRTESSKPKVTTEDLPPDAPRDPWDEPEEQETPKQEDTPPEKQDESEKQEDSPAQQPQSDAPQAELTTEEFNQLFEKFKKEDGSFDTAGLHAAIAERVARKTALAQEEAATLAQKLAAAQESAKRLQAEKEQILKEKKQAQYTANWATFRNIAEEMGIHEDMVQIAFQQVNNEVSSEGNSSLAYKNALEKMKAKIPSMFKETTNKRLEEERQKAIEQARSQVPPPSTNTGSTRGSVPREAPKIPEKQSETFEDAKNAVVRRLSQQVATD